MVHRDTTQNWHHPIPACTKVQWKKAFLSGEMYTIALEYPPMYIHIILHPAEHQSVEHFYLPKWACSVNKSQSQSLGLFDNVVAYP